MTNGEKIKEIFPNAEIDKGKDGNDIWIAIDCWTTFTKDWWNAEYKEPITKNDLGVEYVSRKEVEKLVFRFLQKGTDENIAFYEHFLELPSVTPQEPFINKLCVSSEVCEHDKQNILDKIRAEIVDLGQRTMNDNRASGIWACRDILDKYKAERGK